MSLLTFTLMKLMPRFRYTKTVVLFALLCCGRICATCHAEQYLFLVGVQDYTQTGEMTNLRFAEDDVHKFAENFADTGVPRANIILMTQREAAKKARFSPRSDLIRKELDMLMESLQPEDSVIVGFSGHGVQFKGQAENFFCPIDAVPDSSHINTLVSISEVYRKLEKCNARMKLLLVDACRIDPLDLKSKDPKRIEIEPVFSRLPPIYDGGTVAIFSCSETQKAFEDPGIQSGVFFHFINQAFSGAADSDKNDVIDLLELQAFTVKNVQKWSREQLGRSQTPEVKGQAKGTVELLSLAKRSWVAVPKSFVNSIGIRMLLAYSIVENAAPVEFDIKQSQDTQMLKIPLETQYFYLGETEVTQRDWKAVMNSSPWKDKDFVREGDEYPATYVSWIDAVEFCRRLSAREGKSYRLPTEQEWNLACEPGTGKPVYDTKELLETSWTNTNTLLVGEKFAHKVKTKKANSLGFYDMKGNAWEWIQFDDSRGDEVGYVGGSWRFSIGGQGFQSMVEESPEHLSADVGFRIYTDSEVARLTK